MENTPQIAIVNERSQPHKKAPVHMRVGERETITRGVRHDYEEFEGQRHVFNELFDDDKMFFEEVVP